MPGYLLRHFFFWLCDPVLQYLLNLNLILDEKRGQLVGKFHLVYIDVSLLEMCNDIAYYLVNHLLVNLAAEPDLVDLPVVQQVV